MTRRTPFRLSSLRRSTAAVGTLAALAAVAACSAEKTSNPDSDTASLSGLSAIPSDLRAAYKGSDQVAVASSWEDFKGTDGPWKIAYASTFSGNQWRATVQDHIRDLAKQYEDAGLVSDLVVTESNLDVGTTSQQIHQLVDSGVDGILTISPSSTGINQAIAYAASKGVPVVNFDSPVTSPEAINTGLNYVQAGKMQAEALVDQINGTGNVLEVNGIPGYASSEQLEKGANSVFKSSDGIKIVSSVDGLWAAQIAKEKVLGALASNPEKIDAVYQSTSQASGVIQAFQQARPDQPVPPVTMSTDVAGMTYWRDNPDFATTGFSVFPPFADSDIAFETLLRTLDGQGPLVSSIVRQPDTFDHSDLDQLLPSGATMSSTDSVDVVENTFLTDDLDKFFARPADLPSPAN